ncbi:MAG TPA: GAF domain-containing protein [Bryobacteraceae bacterium]|jgi:hypothetical protein
MNTPIELEHWLRKFLAQHNGAAGTIHLSENDGLKLAAAINIPSHVQQIVAWVPKGKGMAGLALERKQPIHTCNLKEDRSGNVRPGAKAVDAQAAVAVPVTNAAGDVRAVVGIAFPNEREFNQQELDELIASAAHLPSAPEAA